MPSSDTNKFINILVLGFGFFSLFTAFQTSGLLQPTSLSSYFSKDCNASHPLKYADKIGYINYFIIYGMLSVSNWVAAPIVAVLTPKWSMVIGAAAYCLFMGALIHPIIYAVFIAAAVLGFAAGFLWTAQGNFLMMNSNDNTIGRNSGIFWFMLQLSLVFGNLFVFVYTHETHTASATCIKPSQNTVIFIVLTAFGIAGTAIFLFLRPVKAEEDTMAEDTVSLLNTSKKITQQPEAVSKPLVAMMNSFKLLLTPNMVLLAICFFYTGLELELWSGVFVTCVGRTGTLGATYLALAGMFIGIGEILGGGLFGVFGWLTSRYGRDPIVMLGMVIHLATFLGMYYVFPGECPIHRVDKDLSDGALIDHNHTHQLIIVLVLAVMIGFGDSCYNTQIYSILGGLYKDEKSAPAMALFKFFQSIAAMVGFAYSGYINLEWQLLIVAIMAVVGASTFCYVELTTFGRRGAGSRVSTNN
ncbi:UNC93-like protein MFSD11 [Dysidea avara]|uniref:UNC93-like protein MFSD11 n=1 Tax=Dysidea avara TaxID=196820 RepID=UPI00332F539E